MFSLKNELNQNRCLGIVALIIMSLALCSACDSLEDNDENTPQDLSITFHLSQQDQQLSCSEPFTLHSDQEFYLKDFRLYIHDVELMSTTGEWQQFIMTNDEEWSDGTTTLLDFEDASLNCEESGTLFMNHTLNGQAPSGDYQAIRFKVGVPFTSNHQDVTQASAPFNQSSMFWVWQRGYKFARFELTQTVLDENNNETQSSWLFHLGSVGCMSEAATIAPTEACNKVNIPQFTIAQFDPKQDEILLDLNLLLSEIDLSENTAETPLGCMSMPAEQLECSQLFSRFGLDFESGEALSDDACDASENQAEYCSGPFRLMTHEHDDHAAHE